MSISLANPGRIFAGTWKGLPTTAMKVVDGPETLLCSSHSGDNGKHLFLKAEGHVTYSNDQCKATLCRLCLMESGNKKQKYCCGCYMEEVVDMSYDEPTFEEMKAELACNKSYLAQNMSYLELKEYYLKVVGEGKFSTMGTVIKNKVVYPILPTGAIRDEEALDTTLSFDFCDGGRFLCDSTLDDESVIGLIKVLGALVDYSMDEQYFGADVAERRNTQFTVWFQLCFESLLNDLVLMMAFEFSNVPSAMLLIQRHVEMREKRRVLVHNNTDSRQIKECL